MTTGKIIAMLRREKNLTQQELAAILNLSPGTISNYENDVHDPDLYSIKKLAEYFHVTTDFLLCRTNYRCTPEELNRYLSGELTICDITDTILALDEKSQDAVIKYIEYFSTQKQPEQ